MATQQRFQYFGSLSHEPMNPMCPFFGKDTRLKKKSFVE